VGDADMVNSSLIKRTRDYFTIGATSYSARGRDERIRHWQVTQAVIDAPANAH